MKKFKLTWNERVVDSDGGMLHMEVKHQIIEADTEDKACDIWDEENEFNEYQNGLSDCVEVVEHQLFSKHLKIEMPDGHTYGVPVEFIARHHAEYYCQKDYNGDITKSLIEGTLPLFESYADEITDWAQNNLNWSDVKGCALVLGKKSMDSEMEEAWVNGEHSIV